MTKTAIFKAARRFGKTNTLLGQIFGIDSIPVRLNIKTGKMKNIKLKDKVSI